MLFCEYTKCRCMLHARGDVSESGMSASQEMKYAPRTWRCFHHDGPAHRRGYVCSTHVEMFPSTSTITSGKGSMLHARGDVSSSLHCSILTLEYAPRTWRCFFLTHEEARRHIVCSTHVEMFLKCFLSLVMKVSMLHARGDVSILQKMTLTL